MSDIWLGTEDSYRQAIAGFQKREAYQIQHGIKADAYTDNQDSPQNDEDLKDYLEIVDGVAIINISGSLVDETLGWRGKYYGMTGYGDIQRAAIAAVKNTEVNSILLNIKSGGGDVAGVQATADLLTNIDKIKPVTTYTSSYMGSAALWLGVAGREVFASETAIVGSIGTLIVMTSRYRMLQENGIDAVVVRSGKYKALGHPAEPMSDEAIAQAQEKADYLANIFLGYVADRRNTTKASADSKFGQGREFIGTQAVSVGLIDKVSSYPEAYSRAKALAGNDNRSRIFSATMPTSTVETYNSAKPKGQTSMSHVPSPEELAAMAGVDLTAEASAQTAAVPATPAVESAQAPETSAQLIEATAQLAAVQAELVTAQAAVIAVQAELATAKALADSNSAQALALSNIVMAAVKSMTVGIGGTAASVEATPIAELAAKHAEVSAQFKLKYRAGGIANSSITPPASTTPAASINPLFLAAAAMHKSQLKGI